MEKKFQVKIVGLAKSGRSSKKVIDSVRHGQAIPRGDVGAYLVGVFACQPLTHDDSNYDLLEKGQWKHCIFKEQWTAVLHGKDDFTEEEKSLILSGVALLKEHVHGWGNEASTQPHVHKLLESWSSSNQLTSTANDAQIIDIKSDAKAAASLTHTLSDVNEYKASDAVAYFDKVIQIVGKQPKLSLYEMGRAWLIEWATSELRDYNSDQVEVIVDIHLDPQNYTMDCINDYEPIKAAIKRDENYNQVSGLLVFEDIQTTLGIYRIHCRNLVNRQGVLDVNQGGVNSTKAPKILAFLDSLDNSNWHDFDQCERLCEHYLKVATHDCRGVFSQKDIISFTRAQKLGNKLLTIKATEASDLEIMQGWLKVLKGMCCGVRYLKGFNMDAGKFLGHVSSASTTYQGTLSLLKEYRTIPEVGKALAPNFFGDLGFKEFCKPDTHVCKIVNGIFNKVYKEQEVFDQMIVLSKDSGVAPRQLDKVFYLAGSGNFYLANCSLATGESSRRRSSLITHLRGFQASH